MRKIQIPLQGTVTSDTPLRLETAAQLAFPDNSMGVAGLRKEIAKGRLPAEKIAGKIYVTLGGIEEMRKQCRVPGLSSEKTQAAASHEPTEADKRVAYLRLMQTLETKPLK